MPHASKEKKNAHSLYQSDQRLVRSPVMILPVAEGWTKGFLEIPLIPDFYDFVAFVP